MRGMSTYVHESRETLRRSSQRQDISESYIANVAMLRSNIVTFQKVEVSTSRR